MWTCGLCAGHIQDNAKFFAPLRSKRLFGFAKLRPVNRYPRTFSRSSKRSEYLSSKLRAKERRPHHTWVEAWDQLLNKRTFYDSPEMALLWKHVATPLSLSGQSLSYPDDPCWPYTCLNWLLPRTSLLTMHVSSPRNMDFTNSNNTSTGIHWNSLVSFVEPHAWYSSREAGLPRWLEWCSLHNPGDFFSAMLTVSLFDRE